MKIIEILAKDGLIRTILKIAIVKQNSQLDKIKISV